LLEDTLVIWGGEFGRTPMVQGGNDGRDHHNRAFSIWMAGGGLRRGMVYGKTDDFGFNAVENPVHVHDLHATILHLLGFDHTRLTYRFQGRDFRLTDVHGNVVRDILA
jgi:arylsulfatase A-like enzyme